MNSGLHALSLGMGAGCTFTFCTDMPHTEPGGKLILEACPALRVLSGMLAGLDQHEEG